MDPPARSRYSNNNNNNNHHRGPSSAMAASNSVQALLSSDEAPDTGDDSDEDLITSYLNSAGVVVVGGGGGGGGVNSSGDGGVIPTINVTSHSPNSNHILEDNLQQLAEIHENIQRMRLENAEQARLSTSRSSGHQGKGGINSRLSTSCPSLNETAEQLQYELDDNGNSSNVNNNGVRSSSSNRTANSSSRSKRSPAAGGGQAEMQQQMQHRSKRQQHQGRQRSLSVSSGDSDDNYGQHQQQQQSYHHHHHNSHHSHGRLPQPPPQLQQQTSTSSAVSAGIDFVDGFFSAKSRPRSASSVAGGGSSSRFGLGSIMHHHHNHQQQQQQQGVFKTPPDVSGKPLPRPPSKKTPHLFAQFPALHKSISTPSIVVDHPHQKGAKNTWARRSGGSDSDTDDDLGLHHHQQQLQQQQQQLQREAAAASEFEARRQRFLHENTPSPQLSLAEFLQDVPNLEEDDQRKRRRKKERSSIFFRKKKDKVQPPPAPSSSALIRPMTSASSSSSILHHHYHHPLDNNSAASSSASGGGIKSLTKVPSAISLATKPLQQARIPQHSYSMSSLRKPSSNSSSSVNNSNASYQNAGAGSNFYVARGEMSKVNNDERDDFAAQEDTQGLIEGEFVPCEEFPEGGPAAIRNLETDPFLRIQDEEPDSWQAAWRQHESQQGMSPLQVKRQEHIYEFIVTESNHCQVLKVVQKIFVEGMYKYLNMHREVVERIFPCIDQLIDIHFRFLEQLRIRQSEQPVVESIADILLEQFSGDTARQWKEAYGTFCSQHNEAVSVYKDIFKSDRRFQLFVRQCADNPLLKKKGIPECILFVTTRITKYPLLIEPLIKTARDLPQEQQSLRDANTFIRDILKDVNSKVAEKEREQRFLDIYKGIDAKHSAQFQGRKFKKSDVLLNERKLMFEGTAVLQLGRSRGVPVTVVVLSDVLFFLQENNQKYYFYIPETKPSVIPVHTLVAREKSGPSTKALYLISATEDNSEVYEVEIQQPPTRDDWINGIREAVDACASGSDSDGGGGGVASLPGGSLEHARKMLDAKYMRMRHLTAELRGKDLDLARVLEDKMRIMSDMLVVLGTPDPFRDCPPDYLGLVRESDTNCTKEQLLSAVQEATRLASALYSSGSSSLSRSVSSAGERQSVAYTSPTLPRRAETFGGFDQQLKPQPTQQEQDEQQQQQQQVQQQQQQQQQVQQPGDVWRGLPSVPPLLQLDPEQQEAAVHMTHYLNNLMCMVSEHFTSLESLKAEVCEIRERSTMMGGRYKQNQQLEELRDLQARLGSERRAWQQEREAIELDLEAKKKDLARIQADTDRGLKDVKEQRDQLYRKLDILKAKGIEILGPNMSVLKTIGDNNAGGGGGNNEMLYYSEVIAAADSNNVNNGSSSQQQQQQQQRKASVAPSSSNASLLLQSSTLSSGGSLKKDSLANINLLSTTNEGKVEKAEVKQQIPVKLSSKLSVSSSSGGGGGGAGGSGGSGGKDKGSKKMSTAASAGFKQSSSLASSSLSGSMGNISKPLMESGVTGGVHHQILPFKLSEAEMASSSSANSLKKSSPKSGYQRLTSTMSSSYAEGGSQQRHQQQHYGGTGQQQQHQHPLEIAHQRTGSSPALMPPMTMMNPPPVPPPPTPTNALPKSAPNFNSEDKVIYF